MKLFLVPIFILELLSIFLSTPLLAFPSNSALKYSARAWQTDNGLPHNSVLTVLPGRDGYLWMGTPAGLVRFDGISFSVFHPANTSTIKDPMVRSLYQTRDGTIWIVTDKAGVNIFKEGKFQPSPIDFKYQVKALLEMRDGTLWAATTNGLLCYKEGKVTWLTKADGLPDDLILCLCEDLDGSLWIGTNHGLIRYKGKLGEYYNGHYRLPLDAVRTLFCDKGGSLWIGSGGDGVARLTRGKFDYFKKSEGIPDGFITSIFEDSRGEMWIGTLSGLCRRHGERFVAEMNSEGTAYDNINVITEDREGNVWVGTREGLTQLRNLPFASLTKQMGLSHNNLVTLCEDRNGTMWFATWGGGVCAWQDGIIKTYSRTNSLLYDIVLSVCETRDGAMWFGGEFDGGLFRFQDGAFTHYGKENGMIDPVLRVLYQDKEGTLWVGANGGLYQMNGETFHRYTTADGLPGNVIRAICEDHEGSLWIGTTEGLARRKDGKFTCFTMQDGLSTNAVHTLYVGKDNDLWLGTGGGGLNRFKEGKFSVYASKQGLFNDTVSSILEDDRGNLWMSCFSGVYRVSKKDLDDFDRGLIHLIRCSSYGKADGMSSVQCNGVAQPAGWKARDGRFWFPTARGAVVVDPAIVQENLDPPALIIEEIMADKKKVGETQGTVITPGRGELEFHYTALSLAVPEKNRFKYKLEGIDLDWVDAGNRRVAYYNNLKPGDYTFQLLGCNSDGVWNQKEARLSFTLLPHFWQTKWFAILAGVFGIALVAGVARYMTWRRVQRELRRLEQQHVVERERARIAQDMHDELGARLTEILMVGDLAKNSPDGKQESHVERMTNVAREVVDNLDAIVWAVNPGNDSLEKLSIYVCEFVEGFLSASSIRYRLEIPDKLPKGIVSSEVRHNVFLVIKEALNNIVKHSEATEVKVALQVEYETLSLAIEDNGRGFSMDSIGSSGNGLRNMRSRMESIGGSFCLQSRAGMGTKLRVTASFKI